MLLYKYVQYVVFSSIIGNILKISFRLPREQKYHDITGYSDSFACYILGYLSLEVNSNAFFFDNNKTGLNKIIIARKKFDFAEEFL